MQKISSLQLKLILVVAFSFILSSCASTNIRTAPIITAKRPKPNSLGFSKPISTKYTVTQRFKPKKNRKHKGIDIAGKKGSPIFSVASGRVVYQGRKFSGYGKMILIEHDKGISTIYSHLHKIFVRAGQRVQRGQLIGSMGRTGRATGVHLHFELMENMKIVNPEKYIKF